MIGKKNEIAGYFRQKIVSGELNPGDAVPFRTEIENRFKASSTTVNKVFQELKEQGFIQAKRKAGTTVSDHPPHQFRYGVVFYQSPESGKPGWSYFFESIDSAIRQAGDRLKNGITLASYYNINRNRSSDGFHSLLRDIADCRLAGLLFTVNPFEVAGTPILTGKNLPRIAFATSVMENMPVIHFGMDAFFAKSLLFLRQRGRKKLAVLYYDAVNKRAIQAVVDQVNANGLITYPYWQIHAAINRKENVASIIRLLLNKNQKEIPDAIIIADDHLVEGATEAIAQSAIRVPDELEIVAYSNFPVVPKAAVPVTRIGFSCHELLLKSIQLLDDFRNKRTVEAITTLDPVSE